MQREPGRVLAYSATGLAIPCHCIFQCVDAQTGNREYRVVAELHWERMTIVRLDIFGWPDDVTFCFDTPGLSEAERAQWEANFSDAINDLPYPAPKSDLPRLQL